MNKSFFNSLPFRLLCAVAAGIIRNIRDDKRFHESFDQRGFSRADRSDHADIDIAAGAFRDIRVNISHK